MYIPKCRCGNNKLILMPMADQDMQGDDVKKRPAKALEYWRVFCSECGTNYPLMDVNWSRQ